MSKAQTDVVAALRIELDATKAALAKSEGARSALAAELERMVSAPNERAEKAEAACAALRESLKEANDVACLDACDHYGDTIVHNKECSAVADLLASPNPGEDWVSPEAFGRIVAELECPPDVDEVLKEVSRLQEAVRDDLRGTMRRERDEARAERDALTKQVEALSKITRSIDTPALVEVMLKSEEFAKLYGDSIKELEAERDSLQERLGDAERVIEATRGLLLSRDASWSGRGAGHDWDEAVESAESALATFDARKR